VDTAAAVGPASANGNSAAYTVSALGRAETSFASIDVTSASIAAVTPALRDRTDGGALCRWCARKGMDSDPKNG